MAMQMYGVTGQRGLRRNQTAELNARLNLLPQMLQQQQQERMQREQMDFQNKQFKEGKDQARKTYNFQQDSQKKGFGLEAAKLGVNVGTSNYLTGSEKPVTPLGGKGAAVNATNVNSGAIKGQGYFSGLNLNSTISGGLAGFGIGTMMTGKSKFKKSLLGAGAGALTGMLGGGGYTGGLQGGFAGLIGGLFS